MYLNSRNKNISFTYEVEENNKLSFLDVSVSREENKFSTSLYRKPTFSGLYTNFASFIANSYNEVKFLKVIFRKNHFPRHSIDKCIKLFLHKKNSTRDQTH